MFVREIEALRGVIQQETARRPTTFAQVRRMNGTHADLLLVGANTLLRGVPVPPGTLIGATIEIAWQGNRPVVADAARATLPPHAMLPESLAPGGTSALHHSQIAGLGGDDHSHYLTSGRADLRYASLTHIHTQYALADALTAHTTNFSNPHNVTAAQVGAVAKSGDTMTGLLVLNQAGTLTDLAELRGGGFLGVFNANDAANRFQVKFRKSRGTFTSPSAVLENDAVGALAFQAHDGTTYQQGAMVQAFVDGPVSGGSVPKRVSIVTGASSSTRRERLRVTASGTTQFLAESGQIANLSEWRSAGGVVLASISKAGEPAFPNFQTTSTGLGFFGVSPASRPAAYTLAGTATRVLPTLPGDYVGLGAGVSGTPYAAAADLNNLKAKVAELTGVVRQLLADHAAYGLLQTL